MGQEDPLKEIATHSSIIAWKIPRTEEPGGLPSVESESLTGLSARARTHTHTHTHTQLSKVQISLLSTIFCNVNTDDRYQHPGGVGGYSLSKVV